VETVKLALSLRGEGRRRKHSLSVPLVVEPRWASDDARLVIAYHPMRQSEWFAVDDEEALAALASTYFSEAWAELDDDTLASLAALGKVGLKAVAFSITPRSLLDALPPRREDGPDDPRRAEREAAEREKLARRGGYRILPSLGENLTRKAADGGLDGGLARGALRDQLRMLLGGPQRTPTVLVGESGVGKSVALARWVLDLLDDEHYPVHRNADRVSQVWRLAGKRLIAGMSYLGDWEQRCVDVLEDVRNKRCVLYADDLHLWGRIGRARDSDRNLAEFFHGPVARRELLLVGECTPAQWRQLEEDAPAFAGLFTRLTGARGAGDGAARGGRRRRRTCSCACVRAWSTRGARAACSCFAGPTGGQDRARQGPRPVPLRQPRAPLRIDMGEYLTPDAAARLVGDRWRPDGPAHPARCAAALLRGAPRRGGEGPPAGAQPPPRGARRGAAHRRRGGRHGFSPTRSS
jgi:hypothetical protein